MSLTVHLASSRLRSADKASPARRAAHWTFAAIKGAAEVVFTLAAPVLILGAIVAFRTWMWWPQGQ
jgi:hypothetical protein